MRSMITQRNTARLAQPWYTPLKFPANLVIDSASSIIVEIGPGRGDFLYHLAESRPNSLIVAIEIKRKRVDRLISRLQKRDIDNVVVINSDARWALPNAFGLESIDEIHINFPDPWPKKRHTKNRMMQKAFLEECARRLKSCGHLYFATDQEWYAEEARLTFAEMNDLTSCFEEVIQRDPEASFPTLFMQKWREAGRTLFYQKYMKSVVG